MSWSLLMRLVCKFKGHVFNCKDITKVARFIETGDSYHLCGRCYVWSYCDKCSKKNKRRMVKNEKRKA